jgi:hypothetical protein
MTDKLKACPFCGVAIGETLGGYLGHPNIPTKCPGARIIISRRDNEAIAAWNTRPQLTNEGELVERLRLAIGTSGKSFVNTLGYCLMRGMLEVDPDTTNEQADELLREAARAALEAASLVTKGGE